ncbi:MAG: SusF/SusE family outer membrane protein [Bacteroidetes bacterium]|nr:SusF/SusE family outer membrane protein [Bacteroidota bacterium]MBL7103962.1 SusF/SusE family outer membrane protein [Bacteroidales bacterium]
MKNIILIFTAALGIVLFFSSCEKNDNEPKLNLESSVASEITTPENGATYVLTLADSANPFVVDWTATTYSISEGATLPLPTYSLQMVFADSSFDGAKELYNTQNFFFETIIYKFNNALYSMGMAADSTGDIDLRVVGGISGADYTQVSSEIITLTVTTFEPPEPPPVDKKLIYLLGDATPVGWDNVDALAMAHLGEGRYARVEYLDPGIGEWFKFISILGLWAPQWGTDDTGTPEGGPLVYRPDEGTPDPPAMPVPTVAGNYYIEADTANLEYKTFLTSGELYLVGDATSVGWDNTAGLPFTEDPDTAHVFTITTNLNADGGMKFLEVLGEWAPQWGTDQSGTAEEGDLIYRPTESVPDPTNIPAPGTAGQYKITVDLRKLTYMVTPQ